MLSDKNDDASLEAKKTEKTSNVEFSRQTT